MRSLIGPAMLWGARISLMLSVVTWGVGKQANWGVNVGRFCGRLDEDWLKLYVVKTPSAFWYGQFVSLDEHYSSQRFGSPVRLYVNRGAAVVGVSIRHYLLVTVFVLFYAALKWGYRKRDLTDE